MTIDTTRTLASLVLERPAAAGVLQRLGLDYCCGGSRSLGAACRERGLDARTVALFLDAPASPVVLERADWSAAPLAELCAHVVGEHHARLRWELPRLASLAGAAAAAHARERPELRELGDEVLRLRRELEPHLDDEERRVFPALLAGGAGLPGELARLGREHAAIGVRLRRLRELGGQYAVGDALCNTHRALLQGLHGLELDLHQHVHEENNVLFPRALAGA